MIYHNHHIVPRHMGGTDEPENMVRLTVTEHAEAHRLLFVEHGRDEDRLAWLGLAGIVTKQEHVHEMYRLAGRKTVTLKRGIHDPEKIELKRKGGRKAIKIAHESTRGSVWITDGHNDKRIHPSGIESYVNDGWRLGRTFVCNPHGTGGGTHWMMKDGCNKRVPKDQIQAHQDAGWSFGMKQQRTT